VIFRKVGPRIAQVGVYAHISQI